MVFRGKPSRGCANCRQRKIKCDRAADGCVNCDRAFFACPGYRNETDLIFHDERSRIVKRLEKTNRKHFCPDSAVVPHDQNGLFSSVLETMEIVTLPSKTKVSARPAQRRAKLRVPPPQPCLSLADTAYEFFYLHHTISPPQTHRVLSNGHDSARTTPDNALAAAIRAVGATSLALSHDCMIEKQRMYSLAVRSLNSVLRDQGSVKDDKTLLAVLLLDQYEDMDQLSCTRLGTRQAHLFGAVSLLQLRGFTQLQTLMEIRLFGQLTSALANFCIHSQVDLPEQLIHLMEYASPSVVNKDSSWHVFRYKIKFARFYVQTVHAIDPLPSAVWEEALEFEAVFADSHRFTMPGWTYQTYRTVQHSDMIVNRTYHIYDNYMAATVWNDVRGYRLLANRLIFESTRQIIRQGGDVPDEVYKTHEKAKTHIRQMQLDILATVPQHLGLVSSAEPDSIKTRAYGDRGSRPDFFWSAFTSILHNPTTLTERNETLPLTRMFGGCLLPFSLYLVYLVDLGGPDSLAEMTLHILRTISNRQAVQQAAFFAAKIEAEHGGGHDLIKCWSL